MAKKGRRGVNFRFGLRNTKFYVPYSEHNFLPLQMPMPPPNTGMDTSTDYKSTNKQTNNISLSFFVTPCNFTHHFSIKKISDEIEN
jgi:hypothetical protein